MPEFKLIPEWFATIVAITDHRLSTGPLAFEFYEGFPTPFLDDNYKRCSPPWDTRYLPLKIGCEFDRPLGKDPLPVKVSNWLEADENTVTMRTTVTNEGDSIIEEIELNPCLMFRHCPEMFDDKGERMFFRHQGQWKKWTQLRRYINGGWHQNVQNFEINGMPSYSPYYPDGYNGTWGTSPDRLDASIAALVHPTSGLAVAIAMERSHRAAGNCNPSHYCIHSYGVISDLCPGETRVRIGKIFFCEGGLEEAWERYGKELTKVIGAHKPL